MLLRSSPVQQPIPVPAAQIPTEQQTAEQQPTGGFEVFGNAMIEPGVHKSAELPANIQTLLSTVDASSLPVHKSYQEALMKMQQETLTQMAGKGIDPKTIPLRQVTSLAQLSPEEQQLLRTVLGKYYE